MPLKKKQLETLKDKILSEKERVLNSFNAESENLSVHEEDRSDEIDQANADYERAQMLRFRNRDIFYVKKLSKTLEKMDDDDFGTCEDCGEDIKFERLMARPTAELCISCKDEAEREENSSFVGRQSKSLGQKIDLVTSL